MLSLKILRYFMLGNPMSRVFIRERRKVQYWGASHTKTELQARALWSPSRVHFGRQKLEKIKTPPQCCCQCDSAMSVLSGTLTSRTGHHIYGDFHWQSHGTVLRHLSINLLWTCFPLPHCLPDGLNIGAVPRISLYWLYSLLQNECIFTILLKLNTLGLYFGSC